MSAPVRIEARAWSDIRFATLARLLGLADADHAIIKVARIWSWQTEHFAVDDPTYEVDADTIESVLGPGGPAAMVRAKLADETPTGYRIRGTEGQIEWCEGLSSKRQQAGAKRAKDAPRDQRGRLLPKSRKPGHSESSKSPAHDQHDSSDSPAKSSAPTPDPSPSPEDQKLSLPRDPAIPAQLPAQPQHTMLPPTGPPPSPTIAQRAAIRTEVRELINAARVRVGAKHGTALQPLLAFESGIDADLAGQLALAPTSADLDATAAKARHAIAMAEIEALAEPDRIQYLSGAIFSGRNFSRLASQTPEGVAAAARKRAGPIGSAARATVEDSPRKIKTLT